jgi:hypothetical protein
MEMEGVVIERMPVYDPPLLIGRHLAEEPCDICRQLVGSAKKRRRK